MAVTKGSDQDMRFTIKLAIDDSEVEKAIESGAAEKAKKAAAARRVKADPDLAGFRSFMKVIEKEQEQRRLHEEREEMKLLKQLKKERDEWRRRVESGISQVPGAARDPGGFITGQIMGLLQYMPHAFLVGVATQTYELVRDLYFGPGGPGDTRLKRLIEEQIQSFQGRQERADLARGQRVIRTSTLAGIRGAAAEGRQGGSLFTLREGGTIHIDLAEDPNFDEKGGY